jgi:hypothetical protein
MVDDSTIMSWESVYKIYAAGGHPDFLRPFIWSHVSSLMLFRNGSDKGTASNFVQISKKSSMEIREAFGEESMNCAQKFQTRREHER